MTSEDSVRKLIHALRKRSKFEGSDLALLHKQQAQFSTCIWIFTFLGFVGGMSFFSEFRHLGMTPIAGFLCGFGVVAFFAYRIAVYSSAVSFLISRNTFNLS
jgi:hypothetical protein